MKHFEDICYHEGIKDCFLDLFIPDGVDEFPVFVYFHGGKLEVGHYKNYEFMAKTFAEKGIAFVSAEYRKYPDAKYPDYIVDAARAVKWTKDNIGNYGKCTGLYVGGSSAGGYLSMMLCFNRRYLENEGVKRESVDGYFHDAGQPTSHYNYLAKKGLDRRRVIVDETAPLYFVGLEETYPPMHFVVSDNDMINRYEQTKLMISTLAHFGFGEDMVGLTVPHGKHCEHTNRVDDDGNSVFALMVIDFIKKHGAVK